jgi:hypothetical protein
VEAGLEAGHALGAVLRHEGRQRVALVHAGAVLGRADELLLRVVFEVQRAQLTAEIFVF